MTTSMCRKKTIQKREACLPSLTDCSLPHDMPDILKRIYIHRGVNSADDIQTEFSGLLSYQHLLHIEKAVSLLANALLEQKNILIIGDFDADGATSTALAVTALKLLGAQQVDYLIPNRFRDGYGLTPEIVDIAAKRMPRPDLLITVDNGISSHAGVARAYALGMEVLITDHHLAGETVPAEAVIVNPNQPGDDFKSKAMAGVGVIFYIMLALRAHLRDTDWFMQNNINEPSLAGLLDLVALGTVADVVPLDKNNRILVAQGLRRIRGGFARPGIQALLKISGRDAARLIASDLGFAIGPRLNAAGRLDDMSLGVACLLAENAEEALDIALKLDQLNTERRQIEAGMLEDAEALLEIDVPIQENTQALCLYDESWHQGVIGILAGRLKDRHHCPVIIFAKGNLGELKGSGRSVPQVHLRDTLALINTRYPSLLSKFGGHAMAAGLTIRSEDLNIFAEAFYKAVTEQLGGVPLDNILLTDGELQPHELSLETAELLRAHGPWGQAFPEPVFEGHFSILEKRILGDKHLKLSVKPQDNFNHQALDAMMFNSPHIGENLADCVRLVYRLDINHYRGRQTLQLLVEHIERN